MARFTAGLVIGTVERTLDKLARQEAVDLDAILLDLGRRIDVARADPSSGSPAAAADIAIAEAMITRLRDSDAAAFAQAAVAAERIGDAGSPHSPGSTRPTPRRAQGRPPRRSMPCARPTTPRRRSAPSPSSTTSRRSPDGRASASTRRSCPSSGESDAVRLGLTSREAEVLALVAAGKTNREIGAELFVSEKTASVHVSNILRKLGVSSRVDAAAIAQRVGVA